MLNKILNKFRLFFRTNERRIIAENIVSLGVLRIANYGLPLITFPYLIRVIGIENYGLIMFARAFVEYFILFTDFGFEMSATRAISVVRDDMEKVSEIFCSVMSAKIILFLISIVVVYIACLFPPFSENKLLYYASFVAVFGQLLFPVWFFQGVENMKYSSFLNILSKIFFTVCIFMFVKNKNDYILVALFHSAGFVLAGIVAVYFVVTKFKVKLAIPSMLSIVERIKDGWHIFLSRISISLYLTTNTFLLGIFTNPMIVGYFSVGEKIVRFAIQMFLPVFQALFPYISKKADLSKIETVDKLRKIVLGVLLFSLPTAIALFFLSDWVVKIISGDYIYEASIIVRWLSPLVVIIPLAHVFANLALIPFRLDKYFLLIYACGGVINLFLISVLVYFMQWQAVGAAVSNLVTETILMILMFFVLQKNGIKLFFLKNYQIKAHCK